MDTWNTVFALLKKDLLIEWRQRSTLASMLVYVTATVFVVYFSFTGRLQDSTWITVYWIILLFVSVNLTVRTFSEEAGPQFYYLRGLAAAGPIMISKLLYNAVYFLVLALITQGLLRLFLGVHTPSESRFLAVTVLGAWGLSSTFTLLSAITARLSNVALTAILGFPIVIPLVLLSIKLSLKCADPMLLLGFGSELAALAVLDLLIVGLSVILFSYLWRD